MIYFYTALPSFRLFFLIWWEGVWMGGCGSLLHIFPYTWLLTQ